MLNNIRINRTNAACPLSKYTHYSTVGVSTDCVYPSPSLLPLQLRSLAQGVHGAEAARRVDAQKLAQQVAQQVAQLRRQRLRRVRGPRVAVHAVGVRRGVLGVGEGRVPCETPIDD